MSEEKQNLQRQADRTRPDTKRSVISYLTILFAAAIILLLLAYLMQQRTASQETITGLQQSMSAMQSAQDLYEENGELKDQLSQLEEQLRLMQEQMDQINGQSESLQQKIDALRQQTDALELSTKAMDWFWQINEAFVRGRNTQCKELIEQINAAGLTEYLPKESITANGRFSPYDRYLEIYDALY